MSVLYLPGSASVYSRGMASAYLCPVTAANGRRLHRTDYYQDEYIAFRFLFVPTAKDFMKQFNVELVEYFTIYERIKGGSMCKYDIIP